MNNAPMTAATLNYTLETNKNAILAVTLTVGLLLIMTGLTGADAQTVDDITGSLGTNLCKFGKSVESSIIPEAIGAIMIGFGVIKWIPTRKDGIPEIVGGGVGAVLSSKITSIMTVFGISC